MTHYTCSNCGGPIHPAQQQCPQCGAELLWQEAVGRTRYVRKLPRLGPPRGPRFGVLLRLSLGMVLVLGVFLLASLWGIRQGLQERQARIGEVAFSHYRQGLLHLLDGDVNAARQDFAQVLLVQPQATPQVIAGNITPTATVTPATPTPTPTPSLNEFSLDDNLKHAQALMDAGQWQEAIARLQWLSQLDPGYQSGLITQMLFNAHSQQAQAYVDQGDIDAAAAELDAALALMPDNSSARQLKQAIETYRRGKAALGQDWDTAIAAFTELYALAPDFMDARQLLFEAYVGSGDSLRHADPCRAFNRYQLALQIEREPQVRAKLEDARLRCQPAQPGPAGGTPIAVGGPAPVAATGLIAYTQFDEEQTYHRIRLWDVAAMQPAADVAEQSLQPDIGPDDAIVARSTHPERFGLSIYRQGAEPRRLTRDAGDSFPRWSPDGSRILFSSTTRTADQQAHIFLLDLTSGAVRDLGPGETPDWSPDGRQAVYAGCEASGAACGLWIIDLESGERRQLTSVAGDRRPRWSPDGQHIAFMSNGRSPSWDLFVVDAVNGDIPYFSLDDAQDGMPAWSPDSNWLAFLSDREGDWAVYSWSLSTLDVTRLFPVPGALPDWLEASLDWGP